jgi:hypothetical protein
MVYIMHGSIHIERRALGEIIFIEFVHTSVLTTNNYMNVFLG